MSRWDWPPIYRVMNRPSTYVFFVSYICLLIVAVAQGTFLPTILNSFAKFSSTKANEYTSAVYFSAIIIYSLWSWHSDWTRERMWHYCLAALRAVPCYAVWTYVGAHESFSGITPISLYGLSFPWQHGVHCAASGIGLPDRDTLRCSRASRWWSHGDSCPIHCQHPRTSDLSKLRLAMAQEGFAASCSTLAICIATYLTLPVWLLMEAKKRKRKTGHAMPIRAMEDAEHAMISAVALARLHEVNRMEEKTALDVEQATHVETIRDESEK